MNKIFALALPALLALSLTSRPAVAQPQMTAQEVLEAAAQRYTEFNEFEADCSIIISSEVAIDGGAPQQIVSGSNSHVSFSDGRDLKVSGGNGSFGGKFEATANSNSALIVVLGADGKKTTLFDKEGPYIGENAEFLDGISIVSSRGTIGFLNGLNVFSSGGAILSALLLGVQPSNVMRAEGVATMQPTQNLGETICHVIAITDAEKKSVTTLWIEQDKYLLRRMEIISGATVPPMPTTFTPEQLAKNPEFKDLKIPVVRINYLNQSLVFATRVAK